MHFYRSFFSLFPKFHFSPKKFLFVISTHKQQYPLHSTDCFLHFFTFPQKNPFCQFVISTHKQQYPQHFYRSFFALFHFSQKKNSILSILPKLLQIIFSTISLFPIKSTKFPSCAYWTKSLSCLFLVKTEIKIRFESPV